MQKTFVPGFDIICKGDIRSCASLVTVTQPLEEQECLKLHMGLSDELLDTRIEDVLYNKGKHDESLSNTNKSFDNTTETLSHSSSLILQDCSHIRSTTKIGFEAPTEERIYIYDKTTSLVQPDDSGYLEYNSDQYIPAQNYTQSQLTDIDNRFSLKDSPDYL